LPGAVAAPLPQKLSPQLATLVKKPPIGEASIYEAKLDGYRIIAHLENGKAKLVTRNGNDWTVKISALAKEIAFLGMDSGWLDGEIIVMNSRGVPDFNALQNANGRVERRTCWLLHVRFAVRYTDSGPVIAT
jgi:bifunctional non-homologous end joining protein LigD